MTHRRPAPICLFVGRRQAAVLIGAAAMTLAPVWPFAVAAQPSSAGAPFTLVAADGATVSDMTFRGKWLVVYFGYTSCPDICPTTLLELGIALQQLATDAAEVQPLFITIDPRRDTAKVLSEYMTAFDRRILALTGTPEQVAAAAAAYRVTYERNDTDDGGYLYDHSTFIYLMDPQGRLATALAGNPSGARIAQELSNRMGKVR